MLTLRPQPMFTKYNACLRGIGIEALEPRFQELCKGNRYTTTLHVINSAVVKLGKLQRAEKVYRGMAGGVLPEQFWTASEQNVRGGCEYGVRVVANPTLQPAFCSREGLHI
jgi:NLR family CARD domain-containing protein 3